MKRKAKFMGLLSAFVLLVTSLSSGLVLTGAEARDADPSLEARVYDDFSEMDSGKLGAYFNETTDAVVTQTLDGTALKVEALFNNNSPGWFVCFYTIRHTIPAADIPEGSVGMRLNYRIDRTTKAAVALQQDGAWVDGASFVGVKNTTADIEAGTSHAGDVLWDDTSLDTGRDMQLTLNINDNTIQDGDTVSLWIDSIEFLFKPDVVTQNYQDFTQLTPEEVGGYFNTTPDALVTTALAGSALKTSFQFNKIDSEGTCWATSRHTIPAADVPEGAVGMRLNFEVSNAKKMRIALNQESSGWWVEGANFVGTGQTNPKFETLTANTRLSRDIRFADTSLNMDEALLLTLNISDDTIAQDETVAVTIHSIEFIMGGGSEPEQADRTELNALIAEAVSLTQADYTAVTWTEMAAVLATADGLPEDASQTRVDSAASALKKAIAGLLLANPTEPAGLIDDFSTYTDEQLAAFFDNGINDAHGKITPSIVELDGQKVLKINVKFQGEGWSFGMHTIRIPMNAKITGLKFKADAAMALRVGTRWAGNMVNGDFVGNQGQNQNMDLEAGKLYTGAVEWAKVQVPEDEKTAAELLDRQCAVYKVDMRFGFNKSTADEVNLYVYEIGEMDASALPGGDKTELNGWIEVAEGELDYADDYTEESVAKLRAVLQEAKDLPDNASQEDIDDVAVRLEAAIDGLTEKGEDPGPGPDPDPDPEKPSENIRIDFENVDNIADVFGKPQPDGTGEVSLDTGGKLSGKNSMKFSYDFSGSSKYTVTEGKIAALKGDGLIMQVLSESDIRLVVKVFDGTNWVEYARELTGSSQKQEVRFLWSAFRNARGIYDELNKGNLKISIKLEALGTTPETGAVYVDDIGYYAVEGPVDPTPPPATTTTTSSNPTNPTNTTDPTEPADPTDSATTATTPTDGGADSPGTGVALPIGAFVLTAAAALLAVKVLRRKPDGE